MTTEIQKFDPSTLMQGVKDRIKATFVSLIPDEQWETMVKAEIDNFFKIKENRNSYYSDDKNKSDFQLICLQALGEITKDKIKSELEKYESNSWKDNGVQVGDELKKLIEENAPKIFTQMIGNMFQSAVNNMRNY